jgi:hypothetical protein
MSVPGALVCLDGKNGIGSGERKGIRANEKLKSDKLKV